MMNFPTEELVYGKNPLERVVSVEPRESDCVVYMQSKNGSIIEEIMPYKRFILSGFPLSDRSRKLLGSSDYRFITSFKSRQIWYEQQKSEQHKNVFAIGNDKQAFLTKTGISYYKGLTIGEIGRLSIDIEDTYGVGDTLDENGKILLIANTFKIGNKTIKKQFAYDDYKGQAAMLLDWSKWVREMDPSIVVGHNAFGHDLKCIQYAAERHKVKLRLGRDGSEMFTGKRKSRFRKAGGQFYDYENIKIFGREIIDTWFLAMKYDVAAGRYYENYKLKYIIKHEKLEKKERQHYDAALIKANYRNPVEWAKIKEYNKDDSDDALAYFEYAGPVYFYFTRIIPMSFQDIINRATGSQVNSVFIRSYLQYGYSIPKESDVQSFKGAISFGVPGIYKNVFKIDVQSLYPSIILSKQLYSRKKDPFKHTLRILEFTKKMREVVKAEYEKTGNIELKGVSDSQKVFNNSVYGFYGAPGVNFNSVEIAKKVTSVGRKTILKATKWAIGSGRVPDNVQGANVNQKLNKIKMKKTHDFIIVNGDTDSIAFTKKDNKKFPPEEQAALLKEINEMMPAGIEWKNDKHFDNFVVVKAKNYIMRIKKDVKIKGAALRGGRREPFLSQFVNELIDAFSRGKSQEIILIYLKYVRMSRDMKIAIKDICFKHSISDKTLTSERANEKKILTALERSKKEYQLGDKFFFFYDEEGNVHEQSNPDKAKPSRRVLIKKLYNCLVIFGELIPKEYVKNFSNKTALKDLGEL